MWLARKKPENAQKSGWHAASSDPNVDWGRAAVALQRSLIRIQVARKAARRAGESLMLGPRIIKISMEPVTCTRPHGVRIAAA